MLLLMAGVCGDDCCLLLLLLLLLLCFLVSGCWSLVAGCCAKTLQTRCFYTILDTTFDKKV